MANLAAELASRLVRFIVIIDDAAKVVVGPR
jgi:hypothetical protein